MLPNSTEIATLRRLAEQASNKRLVDVRESALIEEEKAKRVLETEKKSVEDKIEHTEYSLPELRQVDIDRGLRIDSLMQFLDADLVAMDNELKRVTSEIDMDVEELFQTELRINILKSEWETLSLETIEYSENPLVTDGKKRPMNIIDDRRGEIQSELDSLRNRRSNYLVRLRELVKYKAFLLAFVKIKESKLIDLESEKSRIKIKLEANDYDDKTARALDEARLAVIEMGIKRRNEAIAELQTRPDKLLKRCIEALESGSLEYNELKSKLEALSKSRAVPKTPKKPASYYDRDLASSSKLSLEDAISENKKSVRDMVTNITVLEEENESLLNIIVNKIYVLIQNRVAVSQLSLKADTDVSKESGIGRCQNNIVVLSEQIMTDENILMENEISIRESCETRRAYEQAISRDQSELFLLTSCRDIDAMSYSDLIEIMMATFSSNPVSQKVDTLSENEDYVSFEEIMPETYEVDAPSTSFLDENVDEDELMLADEELAPTKEKTAELEEKREAVLGTNLEQKDIVEEEMPEQSFSKPTDFDDFFSSVDSVIEPSLEETESLSVLPKDFDFEQVEEEPQEEPVVLDIEEDHYDDRENLESDASYEKVDISQLAQKAEENFDEVEPDDLVSIPATAIKVDKSKTKKVTSSPEFIDMSLDAIKLTYGADREIGGK